MTFLFKAKKEGKTIEGQHEKILTCSDIQDLYVDNPIYMAIVHEPKQTWEYLGLKLDRRRSFFELRYGVRDIDLDLIEEMFDVHINIYMKEECGTKQVKSGNMVKMKKMYKVISVRLSTKLVPSSHHEIPILMLHVRDFVIYSKHEGQNATNVKPRDNSEDFGHFMLITDLARFAGRVTCPKCEQLISIKNRHIERHIDSCEGPGAKLKYPGGFKTIRTSVIKDLEHLNIPVENSLRYSTDFIVYDFEARFESLDESGGSKTMYLDRHVPVSYSVASSKGKKCLSHVDLNPENLLQRFMSDLCKLRVFIVRRQMRKWARPLLLLNQKIAEAFHEFEDMEAQYNAWAEGKEPENFRMPETDEEGRVMGPEEVEEYLRNEEQREPEDADEAMVYCKLRKLQVKWYKRYYDHLTEVKERLLKYIKQVPVLGYNSAKYDIPLIRKYLFEILQFRGQGEYETPEFWKEWQDTILYPIELCCVTKQLKGVKYPEMEREVDDFYKFRVIKQQRSYISLEVGDKFKFLDLYKYQSPNTNLDSFLTTHGCAPNTKGVFCYEFLTKDTLYSTECPLPEHFESKLKGCNLLGDTQEVQRSRWQSEVKDVWDKEGHETLADFLLYYNELDVMPLVQAVNKWLTGFHIFKPDGSPDEVKGCDVLKVTVGIPSVARESMYKMATQHPKFLGFPLFDDKNKVIHEKFEDNISGGPSIVFSFHHKAGETVIRPDDKGQGKVCQSILGYDACSLYGSRFLKPLPHGIPIKYEVMDRSKVKDADPERTYFKRSVACHLESRLEMQYLTHPRIKERYPDLLHKFNQGFQYKVGHFLCDAVSHGQKLILEINSCYYHGCHNHWESTWVSKDREPTPDEKQLYIYRQDRTAWRAKFIGLKTGYRVLQLCECDMELKAIKWSPHIMGSKFSQGNALKHPVSDVELVHAVKTGRFQGYLEVDICVPKKLYPTFQDFPPIFLTAQVKLEQMGRESREYIKEHNLSKAPRVQLLSTMSARRIFLSDILIKWYLDHGLQIAKVHSAVEMRKDSICEDFMRDIIVGRREADAQGNAAEATRFKLIGNSAYGGSLLNKEHYMNHKYADITDAFKEHVKPTFVSSTTVSPNTLEVTNTPKSITQDVPIYIGFEILQGGKLIMLDFYYEFMFKFIDRSDWEGIQMDTDSKYLALSCPVDLEKMGNPHLPKDQRCKPDLDYHPLQTIIKPEKLEEFWHMMKGHCTKGQDGFDPVGVTFFPRQCCRACNNLDQRLPSCFKVEAVGSEMSAASSKCYSLVTYEKDSSNPSGFKEKFSAKGVQKRSMSSLLWPEEDDEEPMTFSQVIQATREGESFEITNRGFRNKKFEGGDETVTYSQTKAPVNALYIKRKRRGSNNTAPLTGRFEPNKMIVRAARRQKMEAKMVKKRKLIEPPDEEEPAKKTSPGTPAWEARAMAMNDVLADMGCCDNTDMMMPSDPEDGDDC